MRPSIPAPTKPPAPTGEDLERLYADTDVLCTLFVEAVYLEDTYTTLANGDEALTDKAQGFYNKVFDLYVGILQKHYRRGALKGQRQ